MNLTAGLRRQQTLTLSVLFAAGLVNFFDRASLSIANSTVHAEMHLSGTQMGWLLSAFSLAYGVAQLPLVGLLDRACTRAVAARFAPTRSLSRWACAVPLRSWVRPATARLPHPTASASLLQTTTPSQHYDDMPDGLAQLLSQDPSHLVERAVPAPHVAVA
jgi:MFS family permease